MMQCPGHIANAVRLASCLRHAFHTQDESCCLWQEVLELVRTSAADFDAVCMATALHKMASLDGDPQQYKLLGDRPELTRLKDMICESLPLNQLLPTCVLQAFKAAWSCELHFTVDLQLSQVEGPCQPSKSYATQVQAACRSAQACFRSLRGGSVS